MGTQKEEKKNKKNGTRATIRIGREIQGLPYAGFEIPRSMICNVNKLYDLVDNVS